MARECNPTEEIICDLREADVLIEQGQAIADVIRHLGVAILSQRILARPISF